MFKNYLITALNNLLKNKLYSFINIVGLAIGLAACILIGLYVQDEISYDKHWEKTSQIYQVNGDLRLPGADATRATRMPWELLPTLKNYFPEQIELGSRVWGNGRDMTVNNTLYSEQLALVDVDFIDLFAVNVSSGSLQETFSTFNNIALSEELAARFFGSADPIGETISVPASYFFPARDYRVTAIYSFPNENTVLQADSLALIEDGTIPEGGLSWGDSLTDTYVRLADGVDVEQLTNGLPDLVDLHARLPDSFTDGGSVPANEVLNYSLQPMSEIYLNPWSSSGIQISGNRTANLIFSMIASLVLVVGCINFAILTTAKSSKREKEVAIRKVLGAKRPILVIQFLGEAMLIVLVATGLGLVLLELVMPVYSSFAGKELSLDYGSAYTYLFVFGLVFIVGSMGGFYPAFVLSGSRPANSLKSSGSATSSRGNRLKDGLVVLQFTISISLIVATTFVFLQSKFASSTNLAFNPENLLIIDGFVAPAVLQEVNMSTVLQQRVESLEGISSSSLSWIPAYSPMISMWPITLQPTIRESSSGNSAPITMRRNFIDADFFDTHQISIVAGRDYDDAYQQDRIPLSVGESDQSPNYNLIINESAVRQLGLTSPEEAIGRTVRAGVGFQSPVDADLTIVGVVRDARLYSARNEIPAEIYFYTPEFISALTIRYQGDARELITEIGRLWTSIYPDEVMDTRFVGQLVKDQFSDVRTQGAMLTGFSFLAVVLACLGLLGMSAFTIESRTKEIGLRKVMGAKVKDVVSLLVWQFSKPVLIANLIAWPFTIFLMVRWLEGFANRIDSFWLLPLCFTVGVLSLIFMWATVAGNTTRIARRSPIHALRYE